MSELDETICASQNMGLQKWTLCPADGGRAGSQGLQTPISAPSQAAKIML